MINYVHYEILKLERGKHVNYVFDTLGYDAAWLSMKFSQYDHPTLVHNRYGAFIQKYEVKSYIMGLCKSTPNDYKKTTGKFKKELRRKYGSAFHAAVSSINTKLEVNDRIRRHHPRYDAIQTIMDFKSAKKFANASQVEGCGETKYKIK